MAAEAAQSPGCALARQPRSLPPAGLPGPPSNSDSAGADRDQGKQNNGHHGCRQRLRQHLVTQGNLEIYSPTAWRSTAHHLAPWCFVRGRVSWEGVEVGVGGGRGVWSAPSVCTLTPAKTLFAHVSAIFRHQWHIGFWARNGKRTFLVDSVTQTKLNGHGRGYHCLGLFAASGRVCEYNGIA